MLTSLLLVLFVVSAGAVIHSYVVYPITLRLRSSDDATERRPLPDWSPHVAVVIAAYNEESIIADKIENSLALDYPGQLDIVVFSDASSDRTDEIVRRYADRGVELIRIEGRVGKTACQNRVVERTAADIVVFSDANSMYEQDAVERLVARFDGETECVVGELRYQSGGVYAESLYWRYERFLKQLEDATGTAVVANGAIYAVARSAYVPLAHDESSDLAEPLAILRNGGTIAYASDAVAREKTADSVAAERSRRIRIATRTWHTLWRYRGLLNPLANAEVAYKLWSRKLLRWLTPVFLSLIFLSTLSLAALRGGTLFVALVGAQVSFWGLALVGRAVERRVDSPPRLLHVSYYYAVVNYALAVGLFNFLTGHNIVVWETDDESRQL